ncbi:hypothetical protein ACOSP7_003780 [Xanthoceras sorbifolium]
MAMDFLLSWSDQSEAPPCPEQSLLTITWFSDSRVWKDLELIREMTLETIKGFPAQEIEMVKNGDLTSYFIIIHSFEVSTVALSSRTISKRNRDGGRRLCGIGSMPGSKNAG